MRTLVLACLFEGMILCGITLGFMGSGAWSVVGVAVALLGLSALAVLTRLVVTGRW
jgi:hypothetical protein